MFKHTCLVSITLAGACAFVSDTALPQRAGQSASVQVGLVREAKEVKLDSDAARGALVGGMLGVASGSGRSSRRVRNGIIGAGAGAALTGASEGNRMGMSYTVELGGGSSTTIITDQREIRVGDCVVIEQVRDTANIRRTASSYCESDNRQALSAVEDSVRSDAIACEAAKQELVEATEPQAVDLAARKIELLCNG
jgi:hypothetical protein